MLTLYIFIWMGKKQSAINLAIPEGGKAPAFMHISTSYKTTVQNFNCFRQNVLELRPQGLIGVLTYAHRRTSFPPLPTLLGGGIKTCSNCSSFYIFSPNILTSSPFFSSFGKFWEYDYDIIALIILRSKGYEINENQRFRHISILVYFKVCKAISDSNIVSFRKCIIVMFSYPDCRFSEWFDQTLSWLFITHDKLNES